MGADMLVPMHFGTFDLSDEPIGLPQQILETENKNGHLKAKLNVLTVGKAFGF
jgi:hypothetical protein